MTVNIRCSHFGNGLSCYRVNPTSNNIVAHINKNRNVTYRNEVLNREEKEYIKNVARTDDRNVSATQKEKVFINRPK